MSETEYLLATHLVKAHPVKERLPGLDANYWKINATMEITYYDHVLREEYCWGFYPKNTPWEEALEGLSDYAEAGDIVYMPDGVVYVFQAPKEVARA